MNSHAKREAHFIRSSPTTVFTMLFTCPTPCLSSIIKFERNNQLVENLFFPSLIRVYNNQENIIIILSKSLVTGKSGQGGTS